MRELALSRGFYSVVVVDLNDNNFGGRGSGKSYGKSRSTDGGKGKGKSKGKGGSKSKGMGNGKGAGRHPLPGARRFIFGRRSPLESSSSTSTTAKSTTSGSTAQHGPRFKRDRLPTSGIKEVPDDADMVTDVPTEVTPVPGDFMKRSILCLRKLDGQSWTVGHKNCLWRSNLGQAEWLSQHAWDASRDHQGPA